VLRPQLPYREAFEYIATRVQRLSAVAKRASIHLCLIATAILRVSVAAFRLVGPAILLTLTAAIFLTLPDQTREIYRAIAQDYSKYEVDYAATATGASGLGELFIGVFGLMLMCISTFVVTNRLSHYGERSTHLAASTNALLRKLAPSILTMILVMSVSVGLLSAITLTCSPICPRS
jgi:hypothetical protein